MSVFLRWGVFGILAIAALVYAYNASKRLADARTPPAAPAPATTVTATAAPEDVPARGSVAAMPEAKVEQPLDPACAHELLVAQRAVEMRRQGEQMLLGIKDGHGMLGEVGFRQRAVERLAFALALLDS